MKQHHWLFTLLLAVMLTLTLPGVQAIAQSDTEPAPTPVPETAAPVLPGHVTIAAFEGVLREIYERVSPSVVHIEVVERGASVLSLLPPDHPELPETPDDNGTVPGGRRICPTIWNCRRSTELARFCLGYLRAHRDQ